MAFSNPIVGGENKLIRDEIESQDYVANVSGWRIAKMGDAEFNDLIARGIIEVSGDGDSSVKIFTIAGIPLIQLVDEDGLGFVILYQAGAITMTPTDGQLLPSIDIVDEKGVYFCSDASNGTTAVGFMMEGVNGFSAVSGQGFIKRWGPAGFADIEDWLPLTLPGGWTATVPCEYKLYPDGIVRLRGTVNAVPNPIPGGTTIATLPADYRPVQQCDFPCTYIGSNVHGKIRVATTGVISVFDSPNDMPSLDSVAFSVI